MDLIYLQAVLIIVGYMIVFSVNLIGVVAYHAFRLGLLFKKDKEKDKKDKKDKKKDKPPQE